MSDSEDRPETEREVSHDEEAIPPKVASLQGENGVEPAAADDDDEDEGWIGPMPTEAVPAKKRKGILPNVKVCYENVFNNLFVIGWNSHAVLDYEKLYLENLPDAECYEKSYMHRDLISHVVATKTDFVITASIDGHVKFWKKQEEGIEFVKHFRSHLSKKSLNLSSGNLL